MSAPAGAGFTGLSGVPADELAAWVAESCAAQGVPVKVTDVTVVRRVGVLLRGAADGPGAQARSAAPRDTAARSEAPDDVHSGPVEVAGSWGAGSDDDVVDQGGGDRVLPRQVQRVPRRTQLLPVSDQSA